MFLINALSGLMHAFATVRRSASRQGERGRVRSLPVLLEALEDRLCLSVDLLVGSTNNYRVMHYDGMTGDFIDVFARGHGLLGPAGLAYGADDNLYVSSRSNDRILRYDGMTGDFIDTFVPVGSGGLSGPDGLVVGPDGHFYISSRNNNRILRFDGMTGDPLPAEGQEEAIFVAPGSCGLSSPRGLVFGADHNLYVISFNTDSSTTDRILRYDGRTGECMDSFVSDPGVQFNGLVFGPDGNLYVSSGQGYDSSVRRYDGTTGAFMDTFAFEGLFVPGSLVFGPDGHLYVASTQNNRVVRFDGETGAFIDVFVPTGSGGLDGPLYVSFHDFGDQSQPGAPKSRDHGRLTGSRGDPVVAFLLAGTTPEVPRGRVDLGGPYERTSLRIVTFDPILLHDAVHKPTRLLADPVADRLALSQPTVRAWDGWWGRNVLDRVFANFAESPCVDARVNDLALTG